MDQRLRVSRKGKLSGWGKLDLKMSSSTIEKFVGTNTMSLSSSSTISLISLSSYSTHMTKSKDPNFPNLNIGYCGSCGGGCKWFSKPINKILVPTSKDPNGLTDFQKPINKILVPTSEDPNGLTQIVMGVVVKYRSMVVVRGWDQKPWLKPTVVVVGLIGGGMFFFS